MDSGVTFGTASLHFVHLWFPYSHKKWSPYNSLHFLIDYFLQGAALRHPGLINTHILLHWAQNWVYVPLSLETS
jgi:hypothetical protein